MFMYVGIMLGFLVLMGIGSLGWYFSNRILNRVSKSPLNTLLIDIDTEKIALQRTKNTQRPGVFGVRGTDGQAIVGPILSLDSHLVTRQLIQSRGTLFPQTKVAWNTTVYGSELRDSLKLTIDEVSISGPLGDMPAWYVPGKLNIWAILVHGSTGTREQSLRVFQTLTDLGLPILDITYRNDKGAPSSPDGLSHLGDTEWQDLEASVKYALAHGAQHVLLSGWSLGGTIVEVFLSRSSYANTVRAVILDSPVLDWRATINLLAKKNSLPSFLAKMAASIISMRTGVKFDQLNQTPSPRPTLLFHGTNDTMAPITISETFASAHPMIKYIPVSDAEHTQCWNANPEKYEAELRSFLMAILDEIAITS